MRKAITVGVLRRLLRDIPDEAYVLVAGDCKVAYNCYYNPTTLGHTPSVMISDIDTEFKFEDVTDLTASVLGGNE